MLLPASDTEDIWQQDGDDVDDDDDSDEEEEDDDDDDDEEQVEQVRGYFSNEFVVSPYHVTSPLSSPGLGSETIFVIFCVP